LTESLILALMGGVAGVAVGYAGIQFIQAFRIPSELPVTVPFRMDTRVLLASLLVSVFSAIACGLAPALQSTRTDLVTGLKSADGDLPGRRRLWGRNVLVVAQVSMSLMLLTAAFLMSRSFKAGFAQGTSFANAPLLMARFDPRLVQYDAVSTRRFYERLTERARALPGVRGAGLTQSPPLGLDDFDRVAFVPDGFPMPRDRENFTSFMDTVDEGFFAAMGIPILRGRGVLASDTAEAPKVAVVNEQFARHYWPEAPVAEVVGRHLRLDHGNGPAVEIVGVVQTVKYQGTTEKPTDFVYLPVAQHKAARLILLLRTSGDPLQWVTPLKDIVRSLEANLPISELRTYADLYRYHAVEGPGVAIQMVGTMGMVGLLLASAGLYGLMAYHVSRRTREIGIRMAIGAGKRDVLRLMMGKGLVLVGAGTAIGLAMGLGVERLMNSMLFDAGRIDLVAYLVVAPSMLLVTMLATYVPARRASRIAPTLALRHE
jgi:predicted permease